MEIMHCGSPLVSQGTFVDVQFVQVLAAAGPIVVVAARVNAADAAVRRAAIASAASAALENLISLDAAAGVSLVDEA